VVIYISPGVDGTKDSDIGTPTGAYLLGLLRREIVAVMQLRLWQQPFPI
jgi:hypothetical protein